MARLSIWDRAQIEAARENDRKALTPEEEVAYRKSLAAAATGAMADDVWRRLNDHDEKNAASSSERDEASW